MKKYPFVSIIIPTFNRAKILKKTLTAFLGQDYAKEKFEIIVVDDGSIDETKKVLQEFKKESLQFTYFTQKHKGPSHARNLGIKKSQGEIVVFVNDDIIPKKDFISQHVKSHLSYPQKNIGVIGFVDWSPELKLTPFMQWLGEKGPQFNCGQIKGVWADWSKTWSCNLSFKKKFLLEFGMFDTDFPYAAWEDVELGYRLSKQGLKIFYNRQAVGYHYHPTTIKLIKERMKKNGASAVILGKKIPEQKFLPPLARKKAGRTVDFLDKIFLNFLVVFILERIAVFAEKKFKSGFIYSLLLLHHRIVGRKEYLQNVQQIS